MELPPPDLIAMLCRNAVSWVYKLDRSFSWDSGHLIPEDLVFRDGGGIVRLMIEQDGTITVMKEYAWNGCSPKVCFLDILWGTPDGVIHAGTGKPKTYYASLVHDALYQFLPNDMPISRLDADRFFRRLMAESEFGLRWVYWLAVFSFGWLFRRATKIKREWRGSGARVIELVEEFVPGAGG